MTHYNTRQQHSFRFSKGRTELGLKAYLVSGAEQVQHIGQGVPARGLEALGLCYRALEHLRTKVSAKMVQ